MAAACLIGLLLGACAAKQTQSILAKPEGLNRVERMTQVPFFAQSENQCGPASLAMMLSWADVAVNPEQLTPKLFIPDKQGSLQLEMMAVPRQFGMVAYPLAPELADILHEVSAGHPVLVLQNLALSWYPQWHYAVVIGYDLQQKTITLHSGAEAEHIIPLSTFEHTWARAGYWAMLVLPANTLPARAEPSRWLQAAALLEQAQQPQAAISAYQAALHRWPKSLIARMGLGNSYYALNHIEQSEQAFFQATIDHPAEAAAFNNLAQVYLDQHRLHEAEDAVLQAIALDSETKVYQQTQAAINKEISNRQTLSALK